MRRFLLAALVVTALAAGAACGGGDDDGAANTPTSPSGSPAATTPAAAITPDRTEEALAASLGRLEPIVLTQAEMPEDYTLRSNQPVGRREVAVSFAGLPPLAGFLDQSELEGAWAAFFTRPSPESAISSIVYSFKTPAGATQMADTIAALTTADYPAATRVDPLQADQVTPSARMKVYVVPGSRTLEYTWTEGRLVGQIILRYAGDVDNPEDSGLIVSLARMQEQRMQGAASQ